MKKLDTMLVRMVKNSKSQYVAVLIILICGVAFFSAMSMAAVNIENTKSDYFENNRFSDLFIQLSGIPAQKAESLTKIPGVSVAEGRLSFDVPMITERRQGTDKEQERINVRVVSTTGESQKLNRLYLLEGSQPQKGSREVLLVKQFAEARKIKVGDTIKLQINGTKTSWEVSGIVLSPEYIYLMENEQALIPSPTTFGVAYAQEEICRQVFDFGGRYNQISIQYGSNSNEDAIIDQLEEELPPYGLQRITKSKDQLSNSMIGEEIKNLKRTSTSLPVVFILVAGLILAMMLSRMVKRDRFKIGILKAMGYRDIQVVSHYVKYAASAGLLGGFLGAIIGMLLAGGMTKMYLIYFYMPLFGTGFYPSYMIVSMLMSSLLCTLSGFFGAKGVLHITPAEAMKPETPKSGRRILLERVRFLWKRLTFSQKLLTKNIFRNKKRTLFVLAGVSMTYGMMLFTMSMPQVMDDFMDLQFKEFQKMDYNISFSRPVNEKALNDLTHLVDAEAIEGKIEYTFELQNGTREKIVNIIGLKQDTQFYNFLDPEGNHITLPDHGILLSENLARSLDLSPGESVRIHTYLADHKDTYLVVQGVIKQTLGINAYMNQDEMGRLLYEKNTINGAYLDSRDPDAASELKKAANIASVAQSEQMRATYDQYMGMVLLSVVFMALFAGILGFSIIYNATIVSINEREMEFSSLRVLGFGKGQIFRMVLGENNLISAVGIVIGIPFGIWMLDYSSFMFSTDVYTITLRPTLQAGVQSALLTILFVLLAQAATYRRISNLDFLQALKNRAT